MIDRISIAQIVMIGMLNEQIIPSCRPFGWLPSMVSCTDCLPVSELTSPASFGGMANAAPRAMPRCASSSSGIWISTGRVASGSKAVASTNGAL